MNKQIGKFSKISVALFASVFALSSYANVEEFQRLQEQQRQFELQQKKQQEMAKQMAAEFEKRKTALIASVKKSILDTADKNKKEQMQVIKAEIEQHKKDILSLRQGFAKKEKEIDSLLKSESESAEQALVFLKTERERLQKEKQNIEEALKLANESIATEEKKVVSKDVFEAEKVKRLEEERKKTNQGISKFENEIVKKTTQISEMTLNTNPTNYIIENWDKFVHLIPEGVSPDDLDFDLTKKSVAENNNSRWVKSKTQNLNKK